MPFLPICQKLQEKMHSFYVRPDKETGRVSRPPSIQSITLYDKGKEVTEPADQLVSLGWPREWGRAKEKALSSKDRQSINPHFPEEASTNLERILYALYFLPEEHELHQQVRFLLEMSFGEPIENLDDLSRLISLHPEVFQDNQVLSLCKQINSDKPILLREKLKFLQSPELLEYVSLVRRADQSFPSFTETGSLDPKSSFFSNGRSHTDTGKGLTLISNGEQEINLREPHLRVREGKPEYISLHLDTTIGEENVRTDEETKSNDTRNEEIKSSASKSKSTGTSANQVRVLSTDRIYKNFIEDLHNFIESIYSINDLQNISQVQQKLGLLLSLYSPEEIKTKPILELTNLLTNIDLYNKPYILSKIENQQTRQQSTNDKEKLLHNQLLLLIYNKLTLPTNDLLEREKLMSQLAKVIVSHNPDAKITHLSSQEIPNLFGIKLSHSIFHRELLYNQRYLTSALIKWIKFKEGKEELVLENYQKAEDYLRKALIVGYSSHSIEANLYIQGGASDLALATINEYIEIAETYLQALKGLNRSKGLMLIRFRRQTF